MILGKTQLMLTLILYQAIRTNLFEPWRLTQKCLPIMKRNKYGRIVNVSSGASFITFRD